MATPPRRLWREMTTREFAALDARRVISILPVGSIEQHGPHLPVGVDSTINPDGACGNALDADAERGGLVVEHAARVFVELLAEVDRFALENLKGRA